MTVVEIVEVLPKLTELERMDEAIRDVEDLGLDYWLMEGPPDGTDASDWLEDADLLEGWIHIGKRILKNRSDGWYD